MDIFAYQYSLLVSQKNKFWTLEFKNIHQLWAHPKALSCEPMVRLNYSAHFHFQFSVTLCFCKWVVNSAHLVLMTNIEICAGRIFTDEYVKLLICLSQVISCPDIFSGHRTCCGMISCCLGLEMGSFSTCQKGVWLKDTRCILSVRSRFIRTHFSLNMTFYILTSIYSILKPCYFHD